MFSLSLTPKFKHPVEFDAAGESGPVKCKFTGIFLRTPQKEVDELIEKGAKDEVLVRAKLVGWEDVDGEFNEHNLSKLLEIDGMRGVIARAFIEGNSVATRKN